MHLGAPGRLTVKGTAAGQLSMLVLTWWRGYTGVPRLAACGSGSCLAAVYDWFLLGGTGAHWCPGRLTVEVLHCRARVSPQFTRAFSVCMGCDRRNGTANVEQYGGWDARVGRSSEFAQEVQSPLSVENLMFGDADGDKVSRHDTCPSQSLTTYLKD